MPEVAIQVEAGFRTFAEPFSVRVFNATDQMLMGYVHFRGSEIAVPPAAEGATSRIEIPSRYVTGGPVQLKFLLKAPGARPPYAIEEEIALDAALYGCYRVEVTKKGLRAFPGVKVSWKPGRPAIRPTVFVHDGKKHVSELNWGPIKEEEGGGFRECFADNGVKALQVIGTYRLGDEEHLIGDDADGVKLPVEEQAGIYHLSRKLVED